jgi:hypothetical protein
MEVTKKEISKSMDMKRIIQNLIIYLIVYLVIGSGFLSMLLFYNPTWGLIFLTISSMIFLLFEIYQIVRMVRLLNGMKFLKCIMIKIDKVNFYLNGRVPVFSARVKTDTGNKMVETNAIYKLKHIEDYLHHKAKAFYDEKKDRIYIITLLD